MANVPLTWKGDANGIYEVSYKKQGDNFWVTPDSSPVNGLSLTINGLLDDTTYIFRVREYCPNGPASKWLYYTDKTPAAECVAPTGLVTTNISETTADLSWMLSTSAIGGYFVEYKIDGSNTWFTSSPVVGTHYTLTGLSSGSGYQWRVKSVCANGAQSTSVSLHFNTLAVTTQCASIQAGSVSIITNTSNYVATYTNTGGTPSTHTLEYSVDNGASWGPVLSIFNQTVLSATYALPGAVGIFPVSHKLRVTPKCADGSLGISAIGTFNATDQFVQYITFQNALDTGNISGIRIDNNPNILTSPILQGGSRKWNQDNLLGNSHSINGYFTGVNTGVTIKTSHIRSGANLWTGASIYNGSVVNLISNRVLADQDVIKVERQNVVNISSTFKFGVSNSSDYCRVQGFGYFKFALNQSFPQPITIQIAYVSLYSMGGILGVGRDLLPADDPYKNSIYVDSNTWFPAQITIPANQSVYNNSSSVLYSSDSLVFLRKDGQVLNLDSTRDLAAEHGQLLAAWPDCNPSQNTIIYRIYYKILSPAGLVTLNLTAVHDDIGANRIVLIKL